MPFHNRYGIVQRKTHRNGKECKKDPYVFKKIQESAAVDFFEHKPITGKEDKSANHKKNSSQ
jgi:hypothetical protein